MKITIFLNTAVGHKRDYIENFGKGIEKIGKDEVVYNKDQTYQSTDVAVIFGFKSSSVESEIHLHRQEVFDKHKNGKIFFMDSNAFKAYENVVYHRYPMTSVYPNESVYLEDKTNINRWEQLKNDSKINLKDYRTKGDHILMLLNRGESGFATKGMNAWDWAIQTIPEIQKHTDRKIVIRPHKMFIKSNDNQKINEVNKRFKNVEIRPYENESIFDVLKNTWATVIFSTTAGIPSLIEGVPLFVTSETSMLYEMSSGDLSQIENPKLNDRLPFLIKNSNRHWTQKEILEGTYWNTIRDYL